MSKGVQAAEHAGAVERPSARKAASANGPARGRHGFRAVLRRGVTALLSERRDDAERALQIAEARYEAGTIDQLALIDAQRVRRDAAIELAAAIAEHRIAVVQLYRALGASA